MREAEFRAALAANSVADPHRRFRVYRNNVDGALCAALRVRFPVVERILGRRDFAHLAKRYSSQAMPHSPVLISYGETFPEFIERSGSVPAFIGDLGRLENCWWNAYHAAERTPLEPARFQQFTVNDFEGLYFAFHPSVALVDSQWAIGSIWEAVKQDRSIGELELRGGELVLVRRPHAEVLLSTIKGASRTLLALLMAGKSLAEAVETTLANYPDMDLEAEIRLLISWQIISGFKMGSISCDQ